MLTSDPLYQKPYKASIKIGDSDFVNDYWEWDPITNTLLDGPTNCVPLHCSVNLSENNWGTFVIQILDQNMELDTYRLTHGAHVYIQCAKDPSLGYTTLLSGSIKNAGYSRGADSKIIYNVKGSSTGIRLNERIVYFVNEAAKLAVDGMSPDLSDSTRLARTILANAIASEITYGIISDNLANSEVMTKIYSIAVEYGEMMDVANIVEEASGADVTVDTSDRVNLVYNIRNATGGDIKPVYGFTVKNKKGALDDADDTCYFRGKQWGFEESSYKPDSYSSRLYSILPTESDPVLENAGYYQQAGTPPGEVAQKFKPTHSHFIAGDVWVAIKQRADDEVPRPTLMRIAGPDTVNDPIQLPVIANLQYNNPPISFPTSFISEIGISNEYTMTNSASSPIDSFDLDTTKFYWLIMAQKYFKTGTFPIHYALSCYRSNITGATKWSTTNEDSSDSVSSGGLYNWVVAANSNPMWFAMPRRRSHSVVMWDPKAINNYGYGLTSGGYPVDAQTPAAPSFIKTKDQWFKWLQYQLYYTPRPRANVTMPRVSAPNKPIFPGDILIINDSILGWSGPGNEPFICRQGDMHYSWSDFDAKGRRSENETQLTLNPVALPNRYK